MLTLVNRQQSPGVPSVSQLKEAGIRSRHPFNTAHGRDATLQTLWFGKFFNLFAAPGLVPEQYPLASPKDSKSACAGLDSICGLVFSGPARFTPLGSLGPIVRILVAEDNLVFQWGLRSMLTQWDYDVVVVSDGEEAWRQLRDEEGPRLAILDWMMPGLDGIEVCRRVRATNRTKYTYILILTGRTDNQDLVTAMEAGADDYVTKPFRSAELRARLRAGRRILELQERLRLTRPPLDVASVFEAANAYSPE